MNASVSRYSMQPMAVRRSACVNAFAKMRVRHQGQMRVHEGMVDAVSAWARVLGSNSEAQLNSRLLTAPRPHATRCQRNVSRGYCRRSRHRLQTQT